MDKSYTLKVLQSLATSSGWNSRPARVLRGLGQGVCLVWGHSTVTEPWVTVGMLLGQPTLNDVEIPELLWQTMEEWNERFKSGH